MDITLLSRDTINTGLERSLSEISISQKETRLLFSPRKITAQNFEAVCRAYSQIGSKDFKTVVVVESSEGSAKKKLAMPSFKVIKTHLGEVAANDKLRNDFADEDDDFFISDNAFNDKVSLYHQLVMLQCTLKGFTVSHIQITDENSTIIKELALALEEVLSLKNALVVFCCDLEEADKVEIDKLMDLLNSDDTIGLMNYLNSGHSKMDGLGSFVTGLLLSKKWGLKVNFESDPESGIIQSGYAVMKSQPIYS